MNEEPVLIRVNYFKQSGKWYMEELLPIPRKYISEKPLHQYLLRIWIENNRPYKDEFIMSITDEKAMDMIGFPMLDFPKGGE